jgi:hypothetical protein
LISNQTSAVDPARLRGLDDLAEIHSVPDVPAVLKSLPDLLPVEQEVSLPPSELPADATLVMLGGILGPRLSSDSPAWSGNPVPRMRSLQKLLVEHSLRLAEAERGPSLRAILMVNQAIDWRLRWHQMRRSDAERMFNLQDENDDEKQETA